MTSPVAAQETYAGFWIRVAATLIDCILLLIVIMPINLAVYGREYLEMTGIVAGPVDFLVSWVLPAIAIILFWMYREATPGKMALRLHIVDARTGQHPSTGQFVGRYFAYFVSTIPLFLGVLWVAWDPRKQSFHDKLANTVVVRRKRQP